MLNKIKVLIVDDAREEREHLKEVIGADQELTLLDAVGDVNSACSIISRDHPDVVLLDFFLPESDGFTILERCSDRKISFIMMGSSGAGAMIEQAFLMGASYVLIRPINDRLMIRRIKQICWQNSESCSKVAEAAPEEYSTYASMDEIKLELEISDCLHNLGIPPHVKGYVYLQDAIHLAVCDYDILGSITKGLYPVIAQKHDTSITRVERSIRHAIEISWNRSSLEVIHQWFGQTASPDRGKPTNSEFIAMIAERIRLARKRRSLY